MQSDKVRARRQPVSIQNLVTWSTGGVLFLAIFIAASGYLSLRFLQSGVETTLTQASRIRELGLQVESDFLLARQRETGFLTNWRTLGFNAAMTEYATSSRGYLQQARERLNTMEGLVQATDDVQLRALTSDIAALRPLLDEYENTFLATVGLVYVRSHTSGSEYLLADQLDRLEAAVKGLPQTEALQLILRVQANEQAYLANGRQEHVDNVRLLLNRFIELMESSSPADLSSGDTTLSASDLVRQAREHQATFSDLVAQDRAIGINTTIFQEITTDISQITGRIVAAGEEGLDRARARLQALAQRATIVLFTTAVLGLGLGTLAARLVARRILPPLQRLSQAAEEMGRGTLTRPVEVHEAKELMTLAGAFNAMAARLQQILQGLEQEVAERTRGLQAAAEVGRATTSVLDLDQLLRQTVDLVRERLGLYYVGLFLLDKEQRFAVLRAGTGQAGQQMMEQGHKLEVGGASMIGQCVATGRARIALDVGAEAVHFDNPLLPETRSEMALPLRAREQIIGAMTVQDNKPAAFDEADIAVLQTMADQVAVAIDNARLFAETQATLREMETVQRHYLGRAWAEYGQVRPIRGYQQTESGLLPLGDEVLPEVWQAITARPDEAEADQGPSAPVFVAPITLRGLPIGALGLRRAEGQPPWTEEDLAVVRAIAQDFALTADNIRLVEDTQRRAARERLTSTVTARMRETLDVEVVLKTAVDEIARALGLAALDLRLGVDGQER